MNLCKNRIRRGSELILAMLIILLLCFVFSPAINGEIVGTNPDVYKVVILNFENLDKDTRLNAYETTVPHLLRASLFRYDEWLEVELLNELKGAAIQSRLTIQALQEPAFLKTNNVRFTLEGTIIQIKDKIRLDIVLKDLKGNSTIHTDFILFDRETILASIDELAKRLANIIQVTTAPVVTKKEILFAIVQPFNNKTRDKKYDLYETLLPDSVINHLYQAKRKNVSFKEVSPGEAEQNDIDARITGEYSIHEEKIQIFATIIERNGLTFPIQVTGSTNKILEVANKLSSRVLDIIKGRITPEGEWKEEPILFNEVGGEKYFAKGEKYYQAKEYDSAVLMYRKAIENNLNSVDVHFRLADIYMVREDFQEAISEYQYIVGLDQSNASAHYGLGAVYLKMDQYDDAAREFKLALHFASSNPKVGFDSYKSLGDVHLIQGRYEDAISYYNSAIKIDDKNPDIYRSLGEAYVAANRYDEAIKYLEKGQQLFPGKSEFKNNLASIYNTIGKNQYNEENYDDALTNFNKTIELSPENNQLKSEAYVCAGIIVAFFSQKEDVKRGIDYMKQSISLDPNNELHHSALGLAYKHDNQYTKAIESYKRAVAIKETSWSFRELAEIYDELKKYDLALENIKKALQLDPDDASGYVSQGVIYLYQAKDSNDKAIYQLGIESLERAISLDSENERAYRVLGIIYKEMGEYEKAVESLNMAIKLEPTKWAYRELGNIYVLKKSYLKAIENLKEALKIDPRDEYAYKILETIYEEIDEYEKFVELLQEAVKLDPDYVWANVKLGVGYQNLRKYDQAVEYLKRAISLDPKSEWAYRVLGITYKEMGEYERALENLNMAIKIEPTKWAYDELGDIYRRKKSYLKAIENLKEVLKIDPRYEYAYKTLESIYKEIDEYEKFVELLQEAVKLDPDYVWANVKLGVGYQNLRKYDQAVEYLKGAISLDPKNEWAYRVLGITYKEKGEYEKALENLNMAIKIEPTKWAYDELGNIYRLKKNYSKAIENLKEALEIDPRYEYAYLNWSYIYVDQKKYKKAVKKLEEAVTLIPNSALLHANLGNSYRLAKDYKKALENIKKAINLSPQNAYFFGVLSNIQLDQGEYETALDNARKAIKYDPKYEYPYYVIIKAYHEMKRDKDAIKVLNAYLEKDTNNIAILTHLCFIYHEYLYNYREAYKISKRIYDLDHSDISNKQNFAEHNLTTRHFEQAFILANEVLKDQNISAQGKLSMKLFAVASLFCLEKPERAFAELGEFIRYYRSIPPDYERSWEFAGTENFIRNNNDLREVEKTLILELINILRSPESEANQRIEKFESLLPEMFEKLKKRIKIL